MMTIIYRRERYINQFVNIIEKSTYNAHYQYATFEYWLQAIVIVSYYNIEPVVKPASKLAILPPQMMTIKVRCAIMYFTI